MNRHILHTYIHTTAVRPSAKEDKEVEGLGQLNERNKIGGTLKVVDARARVVQVPRDICVVMSEGAYGCTEARM
jgi:hypothetical protein